tara:strand:- start:8713 stop:8898 length:186 start_codon:yes stop_codon:yes gene_type:complete
MEINGKTHTMKKESTELFKHKAYVQAFGENPFYDRVIMPPALGSALWSKDTVWDVNKIENV